QALAIVIYSIIAPKTALYKNKKGKWTEVKKHRIEVVDSREQRFRKVLRFPASEGKAYQRTSAKTSS
ncbi:MAG: hypothetical protein ACYS3S_24365, partial [Planctomycetota bacterium]